MFEIARNPRAERLCHDSHLLTVVWVPVDEVGVLVEVITGRVLDQIDVFRGQQLNPLQQVLLHKADEVRIVERGLDALAVVARCVLALVGFVDQRILVLTPDAHRRSS